jgi:hypothetical protein
MIKSGKSDLRKYLIATLHSSIPWQTNLRESSMSKYVVLLASDHSNQNCNAMKAAARRTGSHTIGGKQHVMVLLNVYDLHPNNKYLFGMGGAFHTGIEVFQSGMTRFPIGLSERWICHAFIDSCRVFFWWT